MACAPLSRRSSLFAQCTNFSDDVAVALHRRPAYGKTRRARRTQRRPALLKATARADVTARHSARHRSSSSRLCRGLALPAFPTQRGHWVCLSRFVMEAGGVYDDQSTGGASSPTGTVRAALVDVFRLCLILFGCFSVVEIPGMPCSWCFSRARIL